MANNLNLDLLHKSGFTLATGALTHRLIMAIRGQDGSGKTHFALTAPEPICHIAFDIGGLEGVREKFVCGDVTGTPKTIYEIRIKRLRPAKKGNVNKAEQISTMNQAREQLEKFQDAFRGALASGVRSLIVDQETDLWELSRLAEFGTESNVAHLYAQLNSKYEELLFSAYEYPGINLALIQKMKKQYIGRKNPKTGEVEDKWEGGWEPAGYGNLRYVVQETVLCSRDPETKEFKLEVGKCRQNALCTGLELTGDDISWGNLGTNIFPDSDDEYWK